MEKKCLQCNKIFQKKKRDSINEWNDQKYCSQSCRSRHLGFQKGHKINIGNKNHLGFKHSKETKEKLKQISLEQFKDGMPLKTRIKMSELRKGKRNHLWRGGITPINFKIRNSFEYKIWRESVFKRDNWTCIWCKKRSGKGIKVILHADHIKPFALFPELRFAIDNGRTLCIDCHKKTSSYLNNFNKNHHG